MPAFLSSLSRFIPSPDSDRVLVERFVLNHDEGAFTALVDRHGPLVRGVCRRVLRDDHLADDAFQATFLTLSRKANSLRDPGSVSSWLFGVARRVALALRKQLPSVTADPGSLAAPTSTTGEWAEMLKVLDEELTELPDKYRAPLIACYLRGMTQDEAAKDLGWSLMTVRRRLEQGRELLRSRLTTRGMTLSAALAAGGLVQEATAAVSASLRQRALDVVSGGTISPRVLALVPTPSGTRMVILLAAGTVAAIGLGFGAIMAFMPKPAKPTSPVVVAPEAPRSEPLANAWEEPLPKDAIVRLGSTAFRHGGSGPAGIVDPHGVSQLVFRDNGPLISIGGQRVRFWDPQTGKELHTEGPPISTHLRWLMRAQLFNGGRFLLLPDATENAEALPSGTIWDLDTRNSIRTVKFANHPGRKSTIIGPTTASNDGTRFAELDGNGEAWIWDFEGKAIAKIAQHLEGFPPLALVPNGRSLISVQNVPTIAVREWDASTGEFLRSLDEPQPWDDGTRGPSAAISPDGRWLAVRYYFEIYKETSPDPGIRLWDLTTPKEKPAVLKLPSSESWKYQTVRLAFSGDSGSLVAYAGSDQAIRFALWNLNDGSHVSWTAAARGMKPVAIAIDSKRNRVAIAGGGAIRLFDSEKGVELVPAEAHVAGIRRVAFLGEATRTIDLSGEVRTWDEKGKLLYSGQGWVPKDEPAAAIHADHVLIGSRRVDMNVFTLMGSPPVKAPEMIPRTTDVSQDGSLLAVGMATAATANELGRVGIIDLYTRKLLWQAPVGESAPATACFSPDGSLLAVGTTKVRVFATRTGQLLEAFNGHRGAITALAFDANNERLISGSEDTTAVVWRLSKR